MIRDNIEPIAANLVQSLADYFGIPFVPPMTPRQGVVTTQGGRLNIRSKPNTGAPVLTQAPNGSTLTVVGEWNAGTSWNTTARSVMPAARYITLR